MPFRIEITDTYVHVFEQRIRRLKDEETGETVEIIDSGHGSAIGLGDYTTTDDKTGEKTVDTAGFAAAVSAKVIGVCGADLALVIADKATATALISEARAEASRIVTDATAQAAAMVADAIAVDQPA